MWVCNNLASTRNKMSKMKCVLLSTLIFVDIYKLTYINISPPLANFIMIGIALILIILFYRRMIMDAFVGFGISYIYIAVISYILSIFTKLIVDSLNLNASGQEKIVMFCYIIIFVSYYLFYKFKNIFFNFGFYIKSLRHSIIIIQVIDYTFIFISTLHGEWISSEMQIVLKAIFIAVFSTIYILESVYFAKINEKSKEVEELNLVLSDKITELRKIKHDYGSEISAIYGIYQLGNYEKLGKVLKGIIERNQNTSAAIELNNNENPIITSLLSKAALKGINLIVSDNIDYNSLNIGDNELLRLISNIINNAIDAIKDTPNPTIKFSSYNNYNGAVINIENNGPQIPDEVIDKIFNIGFSTKNNDNKDRGFGLGIVREIIGNCGGDISVQSNAERTLFKIYIPKKARLVRS